MNIVFIGDIVGKSGREILSENINLIKEKYNPDVIVANAENAASGYGLTKKISQDLFEIGIDILTLGNHSWDQKEMLSYIEECPKIIRPINFPKGVPGKGDYKLVLEDGRSILVIQVMLRLFMASPLDDPFSVLENKISSEYLGSTSNAILIDVHGEATSEKNAFAHVFDGKVSAIIGTHTHVPTADSRILNNKTAYQTDAGMTGDYDSVIGMEKNGPIHSFVKGYRQEGRFKPAEGKGTICGTFIKTNDNDGFANKIESFKF